MKNKCIDIGNLQAFADGELANEHAEKVIKHLSLCESCAVSLADLESQNDLVFTAMEAEYDVMVPTERLRAKVFASINEIESGGNRKFRDTLLVTLLGLFSRPGFATVAGVVLIAALFTVGYRILSDTGTEGLATVQEQTTRPVAAGVDTNGSLTANNVEQENGSGVDLDVTVPAEMPESARQTVNRNTAKSSLAVYRSERRPGPDGAAVKKADKTTTVPVRSADLDAEEGYLATIATLNRTVNENKDYVMRPSERVAYERNLAVVDDAIKKMKGEVRSDPNNTAAREVLRSSYKNKIDLLNSVADRSETVASLN